MIIKDTVEEKKREWVVKLTAFNEELSNPLIRSEFVLYVTKLVQEFFKKCHRCPTGTLRFRVFDLPWMLQKKIVFTGGFTENSNADRNDEVQRLTVKVEQYLTDRFGK